MNDNHVVHIDPDAIPVIDISPLRAGDDNGDVARQLHDASRDLGFIYVKGHGISRDLITQARASALVFFRSPDIEKESVVISGGHRGWLKQGASKMHDDALPDLKESFIWGLKTQGDELPDDHPLRGHNQWPKAVPELENTALEYFEKAHEVAACLMRGFAAGLALDDQFFLKSSDKPLSRASFVYYPPQTETSDETQFGVGAHTDFGVMTVLCQDDVGGLQVQDASGRWLHAPPIADTLVVNVGDLLARWTGGAYKSTPHRVINKSGRERLSLVLAYDPNPETLIDPYQVFSEPTQDADTEKFEASITCGDYLVWRFGKAFAYRNKTKA